ncbi:UDP-glycosyltransferase UGT5-like [Schistocerca americana]|uniref:UDP-glycosyltransferase UGT5-like n=1 Tax=Schistocerca americana TaxID=7009 RepID=UPI001F500F03|nr:UDP-glycosyltransferase UGT5-like [Schistocerca americana]
METYSYTKVFFFPWYENGDVESLLWRMQNLWLHIFLLIEIINQCQGANILSITVLPSKSHVGFVKPLLDELAEKGHNLTIISPFPESSHANNVRIISLNLAGGMIKSHGNITLFEMGGRSPFPLIFYLKDLGNVLCKNALSVPEVQELIISHDQKFDLLIMNGFFTECFLGFAYKYNASIIYQTPNALTFLIGNPVGNPGAYAYVPDVMLDFGVNMNFRQRVINSVYSLLGELVRSFSYLPTQQDIMNSNFRNIHSLPSVEELHRSASLLFVNTHESMGVPRPLTPNTIQVGGMQIKPAKALPKDLEAILNNSKEGVIFFSLGSNIQPSDMPKDKFLAFMTAFSKLNQTVLWKWDQDTMPGKPRNVHLGKWFPQNDILGHKNVKLFITHGGLLSLQEAVYHAVPVLGVPIFSDQRVNVNQAEGKGYAIKLFFSDVTEEFLLQAINEVLSNPRYANRAAELSRQFRDQPESPLERAVFWTEYVLRHRGAVHLQVAAHDLSWWQLALLDVVAAVFAVTVFSLFCMYALCSYVYRQIGTKVTVESKKNK